MAGGTISHGALAMAIGMALSSALRDHRCRVRSSDVRVRSKTTSLTTYPDLTVVCDTSRSRSTSMTRTACSARQLS